MRNRTLRRAISLGLCAVMGLSLAGCSKNGGGLGNLLSGGSSSGNGAAVSDASDSSVAKNAVYHESGTLELDGFDYMGNLFYANGKAYIWTTVYDNSYDGYGEEPMPIAVAEDAPEVIEEAGAEEAVEGEDLGETADIIGGEDDVMEPYPDEYVPQPETLKIACFEGNGENLVYTTITHPVDVYTNNLTMDNDGNYILIENHNDYDEATGADNSTTTISKYDVNGTLLESKPIDLSKLGEYAYVSNVAVTKDGSVLLASDRDILVCNPDLSVKGSIKINEDEYLSNVLVTGSGDAILTTYRNEGANGYYRINTDNMTASETITLPANWSWCFAGAQYDFYYTDGKCMKGYNIGDAEPTEVFNYFDSDVEPNGIGNICPVSDTVLAVSTYDTETYNFDHIAFYTKVDPKDVADRQIITLGCIYPSMVLSKRIVDYNKTNTEYRVRIVDYDQYNTPEDYNLGAKQLDRDIITGNAPDIIVLDYTMNPAKYSSKGVFEPLDKYLESDPDVKREDLLQNVLNIGSYNGKLYTITPDFSINSFMVKKSIVGDEKLTFAKMKEIENQTQGNFWYKNETQATDVMRNVISATYDEYLDLATGKCNFDSPEFVELLNYAAQYPAEIDWEHYEYDYSEDYYSRFRSNKVLGNSCYISTFRDFNYQINACFDKDYVITGFPCTDGVGAVLTGGTNMGINDKSKFKDEAWNFVKYFFMDEYQDSLQYSLPIKRASLLKKAAKDQEKQFWTDENGEKQYYDDTYWIGDQEFIIDPMTQEEIDYLVNYIETIDKFEFYDDEIFKLIEEEAKPFFAGQKSAEEVSKIIQSRVQIYVNENN